MNLKRNLLIAVAITVIACTQWVPAFAASAGKPELQAEAAIVMDAETGDILYEKNIHEKRQPASTTKIVTCMLALEYLDLDQEITVSHEIDLTGSNMGIQKGETFTVEQLLYGLMLPSGNDAAIVLAEEIGGTVEEFCVMMDEKAAECGATDSHFLNPNGLNWKGQEAHLTTAYDLALIAREAMKNSTFRKLVRTAKYTIPATSKVKTRKLVNTNKCLWYNKPITIDSNGEKVSFTPKYEGTLGIKTGLTSTAGACFVGAVEKNGTELISVVLHSGNDGRFLDSIRLWDYIFDSFYNTTPVVARGQDVGKVRVKMGAKRTVIAEAEEEASITFREGERDPKTRVEFEKQELEAPVMRGDKVGTIKVYQGEELVSQVDAVAEQTVERGGPLSYFGIPDWLAMAIYIAAGLLLLICLVNYRLKRHIRRRRPQRATKRRKKRRRRNNV